MQEIYAIHMVYRVGRFRTWVRSILSLEPPSDARPACISTAIASTSFRSRPMGVAQPSSRSSRTLIALLHRHRRLTLLPTITDAATHAVTANAAAAASNTFPISPPKPFIFIPLLLDSRTKSQNQ